MRGLGLAPTGSGLSGGLARAGLVPWALPRGLKVKPSAAGLSRPVGLYTQSRLCLVSWSVRRGPTHKAATVLPSGLNGRACLWLKRAECSFFPPFIPTAASDGSVGVDVGLHPIAGDAQQCAALVSRGAPLIKGSQAAGPLGWRRAAAAWGRRPPHRQDPLQPPHYLRVN